MGDLLMTMMSRSPKPCDTDDSINSLQKTLLECIDAEVKEEFEINEEPVLIKDDGVSVKKESEEPVLIQDEEVSVKEEFDKKFSYNSYLMVTITDEKLYQCSR
ncbi:unnamed protein product, partial [Meganyctiphanes norvegica]